MLPSGGATGSIVMVIVLDNAKFVLILCVTDHFTTYLVVIGQTGCYIRRPSFPYNVIIQFPLILRIGPAINRISRECNRTSRANAASRIGRNRYRNRQAWIY